MSYFIGTLAYASTGVKSTILIGFQPIGIRITVSKKYSSSQSFSHRSVGVSDGISQFYDSTFQDTSGGKTVNGSNRIVSHWERVSGTIQEVLSVKVDSFQPYGPKLEVLIANVDYNLLLEAWD